MNFNSNLPCCLSMLPQSVVSISSRSQIFHKMQKRENVFFASRGQNVNFPTRLLLLLQLKTNLRCFKFYRHKENILPASSICWLQNWRRMCWDNESDSRIHLRDLVQSRQNRPGLSTLKVVREISGYAVRVTS